VLLDAHTLVLSPSRQIVNEAADRALHPQGRPSPPLQLLLERGRSNHLATFVMDGPALLESLPRDFPSESALLNLPENARNVRAVGLGVYFDKGIKLHMSLHMNCADSTRKMRAQLCRWRYEGVSQIKIYYPKGNQCIAKALLGLRFSSDGTVLSMCAALPAETVGQIRQAIAAK
ncbi:MAG TPA: hypothetical protein VKE98_18335, partial [Gemmataceae bacterium]|nr:hypothetical protein [Gemmataceae bacterium]